MTVDRLPARVGAALALSLIAFGSPIYADDAPQKVYSKKTEFRLPVQIADEARPDLAELKFYVRQLPGKWSCRESAPPTQTTFAFRATADGEYWFNFVTVDQNGVATPADLTNEVPGLKVVVDTTPPTADVHPIPVANHDVVLKCVIKDANPDYSKLKVEYRVSGDRWEPLELLSPETPGIFSVPDSTALEGNLRVSVADLAGNSRVLEFEMGGAPKLLTTFAPPPPIQPVMAKVTPVTSEPKLAPNFPMLSPMMDLRPVPKLNLPEQPKPQPMPAPMPMVTPKLFPTPVINPTPMTPAPMPMVVPVPMNPTPNPVPMPMPTITNKVDPLAPRISPPAPVVVPFPAPVPVTPPVQLPVPFQDPMTTRSPMSTMPISPGEIQTLNTLKFALDYAVDEVRPGSAEKVEFWLTRDRGRSWERLGDDADRRSPAELNLPCDGLFGIALRVTTDKPISPLPGENPDFWIEVDTTKPVASLLPPTLGTGPEAGSLMILWTASDRGLQPEPISLYYSVRPEGPWTTIAKGLRNEGVYRWSLPGMVGSQLFLRLEVADRAGNVTRVDSKSPVQIEPKQRIRVLGVTPAKMPGLD